MINWKEYKEKYNFIQSRNAGEIGANGYIGSVRVFVYYKLYDDIYKEGEQKYRLYFCLTGACGIKIGDTYNNVEEIKSAADEFFNLWLESANLKIK